ncbi:hypothetical protein GWK47_051732 [Chionoecetes opilio]|uniref:Uncharacterized protein n=1 Tax=Chionoecetes opilio TaxID=41210 RepID=A0A8J5CRU9_CHIOP|nr:hypothetical protein GWK47_051732 [Chionoecetes opilio]
MLGKLHGTQVCTRTCPLLPLPGLWTLPRPVSTAAGALRLSAVESTPPGTASTAFGRGVNVPVPRCPTVALDTMSGTSDALPDSGGSLVPRPHDSRRDETRIHPVHRPQPLHQGMRTPPHPRRGGAQTKEKDEARERSTHPAPGGCGG